MKNNNPILTAVMSKLISERDNVLAQLDLILNKNSSNVSDVVEQTTKLFKILSDVESTIETVKFTIDSNENKNQFTEQVNELTTVMNKIQEHNTEKNGNNNS